VRAQVAPEPPGVPGRAKPPRPGRVGFDTYKSFADVTSPVAPVPGRARKFIVSLGERF